MERGDDDDYYGESNVERLLEVLLLLLYTCMQEIMRQNSIEVRQALPGLSVFFTDP